MEQIPGFREWVGDRVFKNVRGQKFEVLNRDWEDSVSMSKNEIEDDQYGVYTPLVQMMGEAWTLKKYQLVLAVLTGNPLCFTGKTIFADDHSYGDNTVNNVVDRRPERGSVQRRLPGGIQLEVQQRRVVPHPVHAPGPWSETP